MFGRKNKMRKACQADTTQEDEILDLTSYSDVIMSDKLLDDIISQIQIRKDLKSMQSDKSSTGPKTFNPKKPGAKLPGKFLVDGVMYQKCESNMFGKNRTVPVPAHGKHSFSLKPNKVVKDPDKWFKHGGCVTGKTADNVAKQPHIRIEFDDITEVPDVFIDGVQVIGSDCEKSVLSRLFINWNTNTDIEMAKQFEMKTLDRNGIYNVVKQGNMYGD
ncbi:hypothetical protein [Lactiplantibacillus mudanjiangensis]|uniref:Uncharacterized protein n=1 Tax=Lactiplantibacillus mudanjiangensis TaxID=1296538 RepID=A0A660E831_9LACO|nr:hypothetical protein [Lactiplantibacillus mudanjiangensis]VDG24225.1 hypothetical protein [Lactobacillus brevis] [Lactiplantibacillus mudanjiangensis]VDG30203.1 hypothetical protein [Lactobacillus brevis] [Lactiplantibacillus mudanjiangensis]